MKFINQKKCISMILVSALIICSVTMSALASEVKTGPFYYIRLFSDELEETYSYSDDYFKVSGKTNNNKLLTMSYCLALPTFEMGNPQYINSTMENIGFDNIVIDDLNDIPTKDTIGTAISSKKIDGYNIIAVSIRGENYGAEWISNFTVGKEGNAKGFNEASNKVLERIKKYINDNNLTNNKIWVSGYSRAGAVADLTGVYINEHLSEFNTTSNDLYIYTFEAPSCCESSKTYENIYNVINPNDIVPFVCPPQWKLYSNGKKVQIDDTETIKTYSFYKEYKDEEIHDFLKSFFELFTREISRDVYADNLEEPITNLLGIYYSKSSEEQEKVIAFLKDDVYGRINNDNSNKLSLLNILLPLLDHNSDYLYKDATNSIIMLLDDMLKSENAQVFTQNDIDTIKNSIYPILRTLGPVIAADYVYYEGIDYDEYYNKTMPLYNVTDYEWGYAEGTEAGSIKGYADGIKAEETKNDDIVIKPDIDYGEEYNNGFEEGYKKGYSDSYQLGKQHRDDLKARGTYDGQRDADGYLDGVKGNTKKPYNEMFEKEDWMTDDYLDAYDSAYAKQYNINYNEGVNNRDYETLKSNQLPMFHSITLIKNITEIIKTHYPQYNYKFLKSGNVHFIETPIDTDKSTEDVSEKTDTSTDRNETESDKVDSSKNTSDTKSTNTSSIKSDVSNNSTKSSSSSNSSSSSSSSSSNNPNTSNRTSSNVTNNSNTVSVSSISASSTTSMPQTGDNISILLFAMTLFVLSGTIAFIVVSIKARDEQRNNAIK